jgi:chromosome segregation protein
LQEIEGALRQSETLLPELLYLRSSDARLELETARAALDNAIRDKERALHALGLAERAHAAERESDSYAAQLAGLIEHGANLGLQDGHCPLCAAYRSPAEFNEALANAHARLAERGERLLAASGVLRDARAAVDAEEQALAIAQGGLSEVEQRRESAAQRLNSIRAIYKKHSFAGSADNPESAKQLVLAQQEQLARLERALFILDASSAIDRLTSLETRVTSLKQRVDLEASKFSNAERAVELARQIDASSRAVANQMLTEQFDTVMPLLKELYRRLRPHAEWMEIESEFGGKVRGSLNFTVGDGHNVQFLFSSGQRRAAGLAFLLAIHLSRRWCQWKSLLLDDPVQHIDDYRALNLVEVLAAIRRGGRQIIIAVEDTALADLLCRRLRSSIGEIGRRFELQASKTGTSEIGSVHDIFPMPREVLRHAQAS